ncbi:hypothetical protein [Paenibacillus sp. 22594]|uniref:hypothetical protein n=1 Tax=Paenibacillus sp. 22594 TaxID=3453947 RepID=UPI003F8528AC
MENILEKIKPYVSLSSVLFITSQHKDSYDIDIYCVVKAGHSSFHLFQDEDGRWIELFVDSKKGMLRKINNVDEICINFITEMNLIYGDRVYFDEIYNRAFDKKKSYKLPEERKVLIKYRIKVLASKLHSTPADNQEHFILNALTYPLIQLILDEYSIFPASPKKWIIQLKEALPLPIFNDEVNALIERDRTQVLKLVEKYTSDFEFLHLTCIKNPSTTFIQ